uniref:Cef1 n=1 Tax=Arundo donax TaxID=35708 RepID=A0A0A9F9C6_ARUDO
MVPAAYPLNPTLKSVHKVNSLRHNKLGAVIPCTDPSTLHRQPIPILM